MESPGTWTMKASQRKGHLYYNLERRRSQLYEGWEKMFPES